VGRRGRAYASRPAVSVARPPLGRSHEVLQAKLAVGPVDDPLEREADRVADAVLAGAMPPPIDASPAVAQRKCAACEAEEAPLQRKEAAAAAQAVAGPAPAVVHDALRAAGHPLDARARAYFEPRFGRDFAEVRLHTDARAAQSARAVGALAYTVGRDVVFDAGQYAPHTAGGRRLLAHELAHVVQQRRGEPRLSRATVTVGTASANVDYGDIYGVAASQYLATIQARYAAYVGVPMAAAATAQVTAFSPQQQQWLLFGIDVLSENTAQAPGLDPARAVQRLIDRAPAATTSPLGTANQAFEREILVVSGWAERAISGGLAAPTAADLAVIDPLYNPPPAPGAPPAGTFDAATFAAELPRLTRAQLRDADPGRWRGTQQIPLGQIQSVADVVQEQARAFFSPFADTARDNRWAAGWQYSANIHSVTTDAAGNPATVTAENRESLLRNRASLAGSDPNGPPLFARTNFDSTRDSAAFDAVITGLLSDAAVVGMLDRQFVHTGHTEHAPLLVGMSTEAPSTVPACTVRWASIRTLCHELMHAMAHPDFEAAIQQSPRFATGINRKQILVEGYAEALGVQLFNELRRLAVPASTLLTQLTQGITGTCNPPSAAPALRYVPSGPAADAIRQQVGDQRFRAAYFHGLASLVGL